ncbi:MAG TPA: hypothetical protein ENI79_05185 [Rhodospirillales bacterium]|nr:hypothetical protein [Rhodospirillales bacterium]
MKAIDRMITKTARFWVIGILLKYILAFLVGTVLIYWLSIGLPDVAFVKAGAYASADTVQALKVELHLDRPPVEQFFGYWDALLSGEMRSFYTREPLIGVLPDKLAVSGVLLLATFNALAVLTGGWLLVFRLFRKTPFVRNLLISWVASVPLFVSAILLLFITTMLGIPPVIGAAVSLALFPSLLLSANIFQRWSVLRKKPYSLLAQHYRLPAGAMLARRMREFLPSLSILFNSLAFFITTGIAIVEWLFGLPGFGRWTMESILRLDTPVIFLAGVIATAAVSSLLFAEELLGRHFSSGPA